MSTEDIHVKLCYPELLTREALLQLLNEVLGSATKDVASKSKQELIELACRLCVPKPQREYDNNTRRGQTMISLRTEQETRKRKLNTTEEHHRSSIPNKRAKENDRHGTSAHGSHHFRHGYEANKSYGRPYIRPHDRPLKHPRVNFP